MNLIFSNMLRKILFTLGIAALISSSVYAQNATIKGKVTETDGKTPVEFATVRLMRGDQMVLGTTTNQDGSYALSPVGSGVYDLKVSFMGFQDYVLKGLEIRGNITKIEDVKLSSGDQTLPPVEIVATTLIFEPGDVTSATRRSAEDLDKMPGRTMDDVLSGMSGVTKSASGTSIRGNRPNEQQYMVDGAETSIVPPMASIAEYALIQGAVPAEYGNSSVIEIETKSFTKEHHGSVRARGSVDGFNNFSLEFALTGPLAKKKDGTVYLGYMLAGQGSYRPGTDVRGGTYRASQETIDYIVENPLRRFGAVAVPQLDFVTKFQEGEVLSLEEKKARRFQHGWAANTNVTGKIDIKASDDVNVMLRGGFRYTKQRLWETTNSLFNSANNGMYEDLRWDISARLTHHIHTEQNSAIKNVYYRLQGYYGRVAIKRYSDVHKDNLFDYGYLGKFDYKRQTVYKNERQLMRVDDQMYQVVEMADRDVAYDLTFTPSDKNPALANYTKQALDYIGSFGVGADVNTTLQTYNGLLNGETPTLAAYRLFSVAGVPYNVHLNQNRDLVNARLAFSFDVGDHSIKIGADFDQQIDRYHSIAPIALWRLMRDYSNRHIR